MVELSYNTLDAYLKDLCKVGPLDDATGSIAPVPVYLIYGEDLLVETAFDKLRDALLPPQGRHVNYEPLEGTSDNIGAAIEKVNTYSLLSGPKVVALLDARLFDSGKDTAAMLRAARQAHESGNLKRAVTFFLRLLALTEMTLDDFSRPDWQAKLAVAQEDIADGQWLQEILDHCRAAGLSVPPAAGDEAAALQAAIEKGFPAGNHLIVTAHTIDKKRSLFRTIRKAGAAIDCTVPRGERRADKKSQQALLREMTDKCLAGHHKTIEPAAFEALCDKTGFELRNFINSLEKLVTYAGKRRRITVEDVESILQRTKKDPVFAFTNALTDKRTADALFFMHSLLAEGLRSEQILVAVLNQMRKLLLIKEFVRHSAGRSWYADCPYGTFKSGVMPAVVNYDAQLSEQCMRGDDPPNRADPADGAKIHKPARKKKQPSTDLFIAKNPGNPYPVYQMFKKSERFSLEGLLQAFEHLTTADMRIKSGREDKLRVLEALIIKICSA